MRKDVEYIYGIVKGRFAILRYVIRFQSITKLDEIWLTCCALHNLLLHGLDKNLEDGTPSFWGNTNNYHNA